MILTVRNLIKLPVLRYSGVTVCNELHNYYMGVFGPSLLIRLYDYYVQYIMDTLGAGLLSFNGGCPFVEAETKLIHNLRYNQFT
jgi:hypothetical protein